VIGAAEHPGQQGPDAASGWVDGASVQAALERVAARLIELRDVLNHLDAATGDGDLGISAAKAGVAIRDFVAANVPGDDMGKFVAALGMAINKAASSSMGALTATALMRAGKEARGMARLNVTALTNMLRAADAGIQERGQARPGDKTIVDALHPAAEAFAVTIEQGHGLEVAADAMLIAARAGRDAAIPLRSKIGRAAWVGERTENQPDPGTVLFVNILEAALGIHQ
jgi:dihydroxyacetone kinase-like protein